MNSDVDETARLVLMEGARTRAAFAAALREQHPRINEESIGAFWHRYIGYWGKPTHDINTGLPLRRG